MKNKLEIENKRIEYIDIVRGICIFLMIFSHTINVNFLKNAIYLFHMPVFFILSGFFYKKENISKILIKIVNTILVPYFITCLIRIFIAKYIEGYEFNFDLITSYLFGMNQTKGIFEGNMISVGQMWFLICIFFSKLLFSLIIKINNKKIELVVCIVLNLLGYIISRYIYLPYNIDIALITLIYLYMGKYAKDKEIFNKKLKFIYYVPMVCACLLLVIFAKSFNFVEREYPLYPICILITLIASYLVILICKKIDESQIIKNNFFKILKRFFIFCGVNSLMFLCVHSIEVLIVPYEKYINFDIYAVNKLIKFFFEMVLICSSVKLFNFVFEKLKIKNIN